MNGGITSFEELEEFFMRLSSQGIRPGLDRIGRLLGLVGNPEARFPSVHIVGTNGKGSTAAFLESILRASGRATAMYTSPHLESPSERLLLMGEPAPLDDWTMAANDLAEAMKSDPVLADDPPSFFEVVTAAAFLICARIEVGIAVVEAGLGGRLDATNLLKDVRLTIITSISMDHTEYLGGTIEQVAGEKFAVMREGKPALFSGEPDSLVPLFLETAASRDADPLLLRELCSVDGVERSADSLSFIYSSPRLIGSNEIRLETGLMGAYQVENCAMAVTGAMLLSRTFPCISNATVREGVRTAAWPGRFERVLSNPDVILDGAHNPGGIRKLVEDLSSLYTGKRIGIVYGSMSDKQYAESLAMLREAAKTLYCVPVPENSRGASLRMLADAARAAGWRDGEIFIYDDPLEAIREARSSNDLTVCCGSLYLVGYVRHRLLEMSMGESRG